VVVGGRRAGSIAETADLRGFSRTIISSVYREWLEKRKRKYPVSCSAVSENALLLPGVRGKPKGLVRAD